MNAKEREMFDECEGMYNDFGMSYTEDEIKAQLPKVDLPIKRFGVKYQDKIEKLKSSKACQAQCADLQKASTLHAIRESVKDEIGYKVDMFRHDNRYSGKPKEKLSMFGRLIDFIVRRFR